MTTTAWQNKLEALEAVNNLGANGATNLFGALQEGLKFVDEKKDPKKEKKKDPKKGEVDNSPTIGRGGGTTADGPSYIDPVGGADTMYLLTDGVPTIGPFVQGNSTNYDKNGMLNELKKIVELKPVIINTIGVGKDNEIDKDLLEQIARITGGVFRHVKSQ